MQFTKMHAKYDEVPGTRLLRPEKQLLIYHHAAQLHDFKDAILALWREDKCCHLLNAVTLFDGRRNRGPTCLLPCFLFAPFSLLVSPRVMVLVLHSLSWSTGSLLLRSPETCLQEYRAVNGHSVRSFKALDWLLFEAAQALKYIVP